MTTTAPPRSGRRPPPPAAGRPPRGGRGARGVLGAWPVLAALPLAVVTALAVLAVGGELAAPLIGDPGAAVRWALPAVRAVVDLTLAVTLGGLLLLAAVVPQRSPAWARAAAVVTAAAVTWAVGSVAWLVLAFAETLGAPLSDPAFGDRLAFFATEVEAGQLLAAAALLAVVAATVPAVGLRTPTGAAWALVLTLVAIVPVALGGHAAGTEGHRTAVSGWGLHAVGIGAWVGGLVVVALLPRLLGADLPAVVRRFSALAGWAFVLVVVSGVALATTRLPDLASLASTYGLLVVAKTAATLALGAAGWWHRRATVAALDAAGGRATALFWRLVGAEVLLMAATVGLGVALSRSATPPQPPDAAPVLAATGEVAPPLPLDTAAEFFLQPRPDVLWLVVVAAMLLAYLRWVARLRSRGDAWPLGRTLAWVAGCAVLAWVTSAGPAAYAEVLFSAHMVAHMVLTMVVPPLLVVGAPVTLAVRALARRRDGSRGPREWLLLLVHSRPAAFVSRPVVAAVMFAGSIVVFYYTDLFGLALSTHVGHELMQVHFLATGYLFATVLIGVDPGAPRPAYPLRLVLLLGTMAFHAFFGVSLMSSEALLQAEWFTSLGLGVDALADQRTGGGIAWGIGELPTVVVAIVLAVQWSRSDEREARRSDRTADRDDDAALAGYNAMLSRIGSEVERRER